MSSNVHSDQNLELDNEILQDDLGSLYQMRAEKFQTNFMIVSSKDGLQTKSNVKVNKKLQCQNDEKSIFDDTESKHTVKKMTTTSKKVNEQNDLQLLKQNPSFANSCVEEEKRDINSESNLNFTVQKYNPQQIPYDIYTAQHHRQASKVYQPLESLNDKVCPCCNFPYEKNELLPFRICGWSKDSIIKDYSHLGPGIPMFFQLIKYLVIIFLGITLFYSTFMIYFNYQDHRCSEYRNNKDEYSCEDIIYMQISLVNRNYSEVDWITAGFNFGISLLIMIILIINKKQQHTMIKSIDKAFVSVSDFTIQVSHIPSDKNEVDIQNYFESIGKQFKKKMKIEVCKIFCIYTTKRFNKIQRQKTNLEKQIYRTNKLVQDRSVSNQLMNLKNLLKNLQNEQDLFTEQCLNNKRDKEFHIKNFIRTAFVSFRTEEMASEVMEFFQVTQYQRIKANLSLRFNSIENHRRKSTRPWYFDNQNVPLNIKRASEPGDYMWNNLYVSTSKKIQKRCTTHIITFLILFLSFILILAINIFKNILQQYEFPNYQYLVEIWLYMQKFLPSLLIVLINYLLQISIYILSAKERYNKQTDYFKNVSIKLIFSQIINVLVIILVVKLIVYGRGFQAQGGLVEEVSVLVIINSFIPALIQLVNVEQIIKNIKMKGKKSMNLNQQEINNLMELPAFEIAICHVDIVQMSFFSLFYLFLTPIAAVFNLIGLVFYYYICQYNIKRRQSRPLPFGSQLSASIFKYFFELMPLIFSIGCVIFSYVLYVDIHILTIVQLVITLLFYTGFVQNIISYCFIKGSDQHIEQKDYFHYYNKREFITDYDRSYPVTMSYATKKYFQYVLKTKDIDQQFVNAYTRNQSKIITPYYKLPDMLDLRKKFQKSVKNLGNVIRMKNRLSSGLGK